MKTPIKKNLIIKLLKPLQQFIDVQALGGVILISCSLMAIIIANSSLALPFKEFWNTTVGFTIAGWEVYKTLLHWINDGLMAVFFFVIGLEIKRALLFGELSSPEQRVLPVVCAFGGAIVPAIIYLSINFGSVGEAGWGIPMATDIAFVLGVIVLLGDRVPASIKIFVLAFAIIDDLIAIMVIAFFYTEDINMEALMAGGSVIVLMILLNYFRIYTSMLFMILGVALWFALLKSGIHATIAGVVMALFIPASRAVHRNEFPDYVTHLLSQFQYSDSNTKAEKEHQQMIINKVGKVCSETESPMQRLENRLHPISSFFIMPVFALANAGIALDASVFNNITNPVSLGIILGLFFGKQAGIMLSAWVCIKLKLAALPQGASWGQVYGAACLAGMGFTMSLFISVLAFPQDEVLELAKFGVLAGSLISVLFGWLVFGKLVSNKQFVSE